VLDVGNANRRKKHIKKNNKHNLQIKCISLISFVLIIYRDYRMLYVYLDYKYLEVHFNIMKSVYITVGVVTSIR
jgi:hypothetical protein